MNNNIAFTAHTSLVNRNNLNQKIEYLHKAGPGGDDASQKIIHGLGQIQNAVKNIEGTNDDTLILTINRPCTEGGLDSLMDDDVTMTYSQAQPEAYRMKGMERTIQKPVESHFMLYTLVNDPAQVINQAVNFVKEQSDRTIENFMGQLDQLFGPSNGATLRSGSLDDEIV